MNLDFGIQKIKAGIRISFQKIPCVPILRQNGQLWLFWSKFAQKWILGLEFQKINVGITISVLEIHACQFSDKTDNWLFEPKIAQKWIFGSEFQKSKSGFGITTCNRPCEPTFTHNGQLWIFWPKFGEIAPLRMIFWFEYWGCCRELGGGWHELVGGEWSWVEVEMSWIEVDRAGWSWVHGLVMPFWK